MVLRKSTFNRCEVYYENNENVTYQFITSTKNPPKRHLVFSNGYRGAPDNMDQSDNLVSTYDRHNYWGDINDSMVRRLNAYDKTSYIDGSHRISTSNHLSYANFAQSMLRTGLCPVHTSEIVGLECSYGAMPHNHLNDVPNPVGFDVRKNAGKKAGKAFITKLYSDPRSIGVIDTIDIVAHSMGYAYAVGFMKELLDDVIIGKVYIFAPENACSGKNDWSKFEEVWQYGSNNNPNPSTDGIDCTTEGTRDSGYKQDGVAPQCAVMGFENSQLQIPHGRAYIPKNVEMPDFLFGNYGGCHYIDNYGWIFNIKAGKYGYVKTR